MVKPKKKIGLKWKVLAGWLGLELLALPFALPAAAIMKDRVSFNVPQKVVAVPMPAQPGQTVYLVASNSAFAVVSSGAVTELSVSVQQSGNYEGVTFGAKSQMPGEATACAVPTTGSPSRIYTAGFKTAKRRGSPQEQAVKITVSYDPQLTPDISVVTMDEASARSVVLAYPCEFKLG